MNKMSNRAVSAKKLGKFEDRYLTADGSARAYVPLQGVRTLWFNTGTLCNIECVNCYIKSSPKNDDLVYISAAEFDGYMDQLAASDWPVEEIGFTGGEPFMNPDIIKMAEKALTQGYSVLILTNAMRPMMRAKMRAGLLDLNRKFGAQLTLRVSLDHHRALENDKIRGPGSFDIALKGMGWLRDNGFSVHVASRTVWGESEAVSRENFARLFARHGFQVDASNPAHLVLFPEMDETADVPEITTGCWEILNKHPSDVMCATSRMVVKRKGAAAPTVLACTLLAYEPEFELGPDLADAEGDIFLNHRHCAKFCVLGGASCSA